MFNGATSFNQDVSKWNTAAVTSMASMFESATSFNQDIGKWNTAAVTSMANTFNGATSFNRDLSSWNVDKVGSTCTRLRGERRRVDAAEAASPRQLHCICHFDQRSHRSLPHCRCGRYRCGQRRHVHEARPAAPVGAQCGFQRCRAGQVVHEWRHRYERHVQGCRQLQREHWQLGHELGDDHGGHVHRRQHLQPGHQRMEHGCGDEHAVDVLTCHILQPGHRQVEHGRGDEHAVDVQVPHPSTRTSAVERRQGRFHCIDFEANTGEAWTLPKPLSPPAALDLPLRPTESPYSAPMPASEMSVWSTASRTRSATGRACWSW